MKETERKTAGGVSFCSLLTILFIALKLTGVIDWSWGWVLAPLLLPVAVFGAIAIACKIICAIADRKLLQIRHRK